MHNLYELHILNFFILVYSLKLHFWPSLPIDNRKKNTFDLTPIASWVYINKHPDLCYIFHIWWVNSLYIWMYFKRKYFERAIKLIEIKCSITVKIVEYYHGLLKCPKVFKKIHCNNWLVKYGLTIIVSNR